VSVAAFADQRNRVFAVAGLLIGLAVVGAFRRCGTSSPSDVDDAKPAGMFLVARADALARALATASRLEGTTLGTAAARGRSRVGSCAIVESEAPDGKLETLLVELRCAEQRPVLAPLAALLGPDVDMAVASGRGGPWTTFVSRVDGDGGLAGELRFPPHLADLSTLLVPDEQQPGPPLFKTDDSIVRARVRVRHGFDFAALTPKTETAEKLKLPDFTGVFSGALLDGTWEAAVYGPADGKVVPRIAFALGVRSSRLAESAMKGLLSELETTWKLHRSPFSTGAGEGACLPGLTVLPELAPCWILARDHIAVGWNRDALTFALAGGANPADGESRSHLRLDFLTMASADNALTKTAFGEAASPLPAYPWASLQLDAASSGVLRVRLPVRAQP
jgi:hypothetical protein